MPLWSQNRSALIFMMQSKWSRTRIGGAHGGQPHEGAVHCTAVCRVRRSLGRASYRMNEYHGLGHCSRDAIGMTGSFMLLIYVYNEFSFDKFNTNTDRLYRVLRNQPSNGELMTNGATPIPLAPAMIKDYPEIEKVARTNWPYDVLVNYKDKSLKVNTMAADPSILDMFSFDFIRGSKKNAFNDISSIVLTESSAKSIFGDANPIGQVIKFNNQVPLKVSAVIKDNPVNSTFNFNALI